MEKDFRDNLAESIRDWIGEILEFILRRPLPRAHRRTGDEGAPAEPPEVCLFLQFSGDAVGAAIGVTEGDLALLASRRTALALAAEVFPAQSPSAATRVDTYASTHDEMKLIKSVLGEVLNILAGKILKTLSSAGRVRRVTAPSCLFGRDLRVIAGQDDGAGHGAAAAVDTWFGRFDIYLNLSPGGKTTGAAAPGADAPGG